MQTLCHGKCVGRNDMDGDHVLSGARPSGSRDDEREGGAAVMFHVQPRPPQ